MIAGTISIELAANVARISRDMDQARKVVGNATASMERAANSVRAAFGGIFAGLGLSQLVQMSDQYAKFTAQLRLATQSTREYAAAYIDVKRIASSSQSDLSAVGVLYARIANGTRELGISQAKVSAITETVSMGLKVSGATAQETSSAMLQLSQAFGAGRLNGQEFIAVNEAAPRLMKALADGMGVPIGALKEMSAEGKITSAIMAEVLPKALEDLRREAKEVQTIAGAFTVLKNNLMEFVGVQANANGGVAALTGAIGLLANNLAVIGTAMAALTAIKLALWMEALAVKTLTAAAASTAHRTATVAAAQATAASTAAEVVNLQARAAMIVELRAETLATIVSANAVITSTASDAAKTLALQSRSVAMIEVAALGRAQIAVDAALVTSTTAAATATTALTATTWRAAIAARAMAAAVWAFANPLASITIALGLGATAWTMWSNRAKDAIDEVEGKQAASTSEILGNLEKQNEKLRDRIALAKGGNIDAAKTVGPETDKLASVLKDINALKAQGNAISGSDQVLLIELQGNYAKLTKEIGAGVDLTRELAGFGDKTKADTWLTKYASQAEKLSAELALAKKEMGSAFSPEMERRIRAQFAAKDAGARQEKTAYQNLVTSIGEKIAANKLELAGHDSLTEAQKMTIKLDEAIASGKNKLTPKHIAEARALIDVVAAQEALKKSRTDEIEMAKASAAANATNLENLSQVTIQLRADAQAQQDHNDRIGLGAVAIGELDAKRFEHLASLKDEKAELAELIDWTGGMSQAYRDQAQALRDRAAATRVGASKSENLDSTKAKELLDILVAVDNATKSAADGMAASFGRVGSAIGGLTTALSGYAVQQQAITAKLAADKADPKNGPDKIAKMEIAAAHASAQAKVKSYGDMAGAAKGFFKENSTGYKVMEGAEKAYRAVEMAMAVETMLLKSGLTAAFTSLFVSSKATETAATVATVPVTVAAEGVKQGVLATTAMAGAVAVPFPGNLVAVGIVAAMLAAIGLSSGGGGRPAATTYQDRQKKQGTGTVLGDDTAKSESISKSLETMEKNSALELGYQNSMLQALRSIETALGGAAKGIFQTAGLTGGSAFGTQNSSSKSFFGSDKSTTITDTGVRFSGSLGDLRAGMGRGTQYEDVTRTSDGGWFSGNKTSNSTNTKALSEAAMKPFTLIFDSMGELLVGAGVKLGVDSAALNDAINQISIDFAVSTRDLKGQDLVDALSAGVGVAFDQVTAAAFPHMEKFQKVGEGMGETLVRVASEYSALDAALSSIGMTFGAVGVDSLEARDRLVMLSGGIDKLAEQTASFTENYLTEAERLAPVQKHVTEQLAAMGLSSIKTRDDFKAVVLGLQEGGALATKAGAETFAGLMALESAFAKVVPAIEAATDAVANQAEAARNAASALMGNVDGAMGVLQRVVDAEKTRLTKAHEVTMNALQQRIDTETAGIAKHKALSDAIASTLGQMSISGNEGGNRAAAQAQITAALAMARAGAMPAADSLKGALSILSKDSSDMFSTMQDYQRDFYRTQYELAELGKLSDVALSVEEKTLAALIAQKDLAQAAYDAEIGRLDAVVESARKQIDILNGIDTTGLTIVQALEAVRLAILSAQQNPVVASGASINDAYKSALGRAPDAAGMEFFQGQAAAGTSIGAIVDAIKNSPEARAQSLFQSVLGRTGDAGGIAFWTKALAGGMSEQAARDMMMQSDEYKKNLRGFAVGTNSVPYDMQAMIHEGERIIPAADNRALMAALRNPSESNAVLVSAVERLTATVAKQQEALDRIANSSEDHRNLFDSSTAGGGAMVVEVINKVATVAA